MPKSQAEVTGDFGIIYTIPTWPKDKGSLLFAVEALGTYLLNHFITKKICKPQKFITQP